MRPFFMEMDKVRRVYFIDNSYSSLLSSLFCYPDRYKNKTNNKNEEQTCDSALTRIKQIFIGLQTLFHFVS